VSVFDIQVGTAITVAVADGSRAGQPAEVRYLDCWAEGVFARAAKLDWLRKGSDAGQLPNAVAVLRDGLDDFRPRPFSDGEWVTLRECFEFNRSGMKSGNDPAFIDATRTTLVQKVDAFLTQANGAKHNRALLRLLAYRPCDVRWLYNDLALLNRPGPALQRVWGSNNVALYALPGGTGAGPAVWCHGLLPDYHAFRGSYGGYAFPLHDRRPEVASSNVSAALIGGLSAVYGVPVAPEDIFNTILCLLSAHSYSQRFAEDLEDVLPHVPFPADHATFVRAARLGADIQAVQTFARPPVGLADPAFVRLATVPAPGAALRAREPDGTRLTLCADGSGQVDGLPAALWGFEVSGYPVLQRWLEGRENEPVDLALFDAFRDVCARLGELADLFRSADNILDDALRAPLTRTALWPQP